MLVASLHTRYIDLFPLNWYVVGFEYGLDGFCHLGSNPVTRNQRHCVFPSILRWLEDVLNKEFHVRLGSHIVLVYSFRSTYGLDGSKGSRGSLGVSHKALISC